MQLINLKIAFCLGPKYAACTLMIELRQEIFLAQTWCRTLWGSTQVVFKLISCIRIVTRNGDLFMDKKVVAVLFGGASNEHEISKLSAASVISALNEEKYFILPIYITRDGRWFLYDGGRENIKNLQWEKFATPCVLSPHACHHGILRLVGDKFKVMHVDVVFPVLHGKNGEDGTVQGLLEMAGIPYVGSGVLASATCMDKARCNLIADKIGLRQGEYAVFGRDCVENGIEAVAKKIRYKIGYPCFVKPVRTGSSVGVSLAANKKELLAALLEAAKHDCKIIVEKGISGRELECAVLGNENPEASVVGEIMYEGKFYDYDTKYISNTSKALIPAEIPEEVAEKVRRMSLEIYKACECKGLARVDFFLEEATGEVLFNEVNTMPGFTNISMYPMLWRAAGMTDTDLVDKLVGFALEEN